MTGFLTKRELRNYIGLADKAEQVAWLQKHGIHHVVNAAGCIKVTWAAVDRIGSAPAQAWTPDLTQLSRSA